MLTIAVISQKGGAGKQGGAGKPTLSINLAVASELAGQPVVVDLDPQASAATWADSRQTETPVVVSAQATRLAGVLSTARDHGASLALIDTAPHAEAAALTAAREADLVLVPCRPSILDIRAVSASQDIARLAGTPAVAVLCSVPARGSLAPEAKSALESFQLEVSPVRIGHRTAFVHAMTIGRGVQEHEPRGKAACEIFRLYDWIHTRATAQSPKGAGP